MIGDRAEQWRQHDDDQTGRRIDRAEPERRFGRRQRRRPVLFKKQREKSGDHDRGEGRIGPVVKRPGKLTALVCLQYASDVPNHVLVDIRCQN